MNVKTAEEGHYIIENVPEMIELRNASGESIYVCMADSGFAFSYACPNKQVRMYSLKEGVLKRLKICDFNG